jgi:hypothetical protein
MANEIRPSSSQRILMPVSTLPVHHTRTGTDKSGRARMNRLTSQGHVTLLIVHFVRTLNSKGEPFGSPFSFGGDGWNGFGPLALTLRARFARLSAGKAGLG